MATVFLSPDLWTGINMAYNNKVFVIIMFKFVLCFGKLWFVLMLNECWLLCEGLAEYTCIVVNCTLQQNLTNPYLNRENNANI